MRSRLHSVHELDFCLVWAKIENDPWWPGIVIPGQVCKKIKPGYVWVFWNSENNVSLVEGLLAVDFRENFFRFHDPSLIDEGYLADNITIIKCHAWQQGYRIQSWSDENTLSWARNGFLPLKQLSTETRGLPQLIMEAVIDAGMGLCSVSVDRSCVHKYKLDETKLVTGDFPKKQKLSADQKKNIERYKQGERICIACMKQTENSDEHPLFDGVICNDCKVRAQKYMFTTKENKLVACAICFWKSDVSCKSTSCLWTLCTMCCSAYTIRVPSRSCIRCLDEGNNFVLRVSDNRLNKVLHLFSPSVTDTACIPIHTICCKKQLRVLSLFDGIGTGLYVLHQLLLPVAKYFASEIDPHAMMISDKNFPGQITHLGDVTHLSDDELKKILADGNIDLLLGGSPCNDLSLVNHSRKGLYDLQGTGPLFFHYQNILMKLRLLQPRDHMLFYFYENVAHLDNKTKNTISLFLGHKPTIMDATHFSAQDRRRSFWGNVPGMHKTVQLKEDHKLQDYICGNPYASRQKLRTLTKSSDIAKDSVGNFLIDGNGKPLSLTIETLEEIFGFNAGFTNHEDISSYKRRRLLATAWSVPVVSRLLQGLKLFFHSDNKMQ